MKAQYTPEFLRLHLKTERCRTPLRRPTPEQRYMMRNIFKISIFTIIIFLQSSSIIKSQTPSWRPNEIGLFYFRHLADIDYLGAQWVRMAIPWCILQPDSNTWDWSRFDHRIQQVGDAGIKVDLTLRIGQGWMNAMPLSQEETYSLPPGDLTETWSDEFGHSRTYYTFIYELVSRYRPAAVNIENEATASNFFRGTLDEYIRILKTARLASKAAHPATL